MQNTKKTKKCSLTRDPYSREKDLTYLYTWHVACNASEILDTWCVAWNANGKMHVSDNLQMISGMLHVMLM